MIELTREETINILKALSKFEGYLFCVKEHGSDEIAKEIEPQAKLLIGKLKDE